MKHIGRILLLGLALFYLSGCSTTPKPGCSLEDARMAEGPVLIQRGEHFYLRYRRVIADDQFNLRLVLFVKKTKDAGYYWFSGPISAFEWGNLIERPLVYDGLEELARAGHIYWLDPDGTRQLIATRGDD